MNLTFELKQRWPTATDEQLDTIVWMTPFPCTTGEEVLAALDEMKTKWGDDPSIVINKQMAEFDQNWEDHKERTKNEENPAIS